MRRIVIERLECAPEEEAEWEKLKSAIKDLSLMTRGVTHLTLCGMRFVVEERKEVIFWSACGHEDEYPVAKTYWSES